MDKTTAIILLVLLAVLLIGLFKVLLPSIKIYINRMPKGIFVLLFLVVVGVMVYLVYFLVTDRTGGISGNNAENEIQADGSDEDRPVKENCIVLSGNDVLIENQRADSDKLNKYIDYRVENNIPLTIVDDYSTAALIRDVKALCDRKGVRYSIEDETWLE